MLLATSYLDRPHGSRCHWLHWAPLTRVNGIKSQKRKDHSWALLESAIDFFLLKVSWDKYFCCHQLHNLSTILQLCIFWNSCFALAHCGAGGTQWPVGNTAEKQHHSQSTGSIFILKLFSLSKSGQYFYSQTIFTLKVLDVFSFLNYFHAQFTSSIFIPKLFSLSKWAVFSFSNYIHAQSTSSIFITFIINFHSFILPMYMMFFSEVFSWLVLAEDDA